MYQWISCDDHLPPYDRSVLAWDGTTVGESYRGHTDGEGEHWFMLGEGEEWPDVTHWMLMPDPPTLPAVPA